MAANAPRPAPGPFPGGSRYRAFGAFLKEKFGCRVHKISVDAGFTCPNRDGTVAYGGCTYCNNDAFRPASARRPDSVAEQIRNGMEYLRRRYRARKFIIYFQPFTNTFAPLAQLIPLFEGALAHPGVVGLAAGTRPDCMDDEKLAWLEGRARTHFITLEYGLESIHDRTLVRVNRGHDYACWLDAVRRTRGRGIYIAAHLILGFPWESREEMLAMADAVSAAGIDFLKLHHLHIVHGTALADEYFTNPFPVLAYGDYLDLLAAFLERLSPEICIERLFGTAPDELLIAPCWNKTRAEIQRDIKQTLAARGTWQGKLYQPQA